MRAGVRTSSGFAGLAAISFLTKGRPQGAALFPYTTLFRSIRASDNVLVADFEEGATGASPGQNHQIGRAPALTTHLRCHPTATYDGTKRQLFVNVPLEAELPVGEPPRFDSVQQAALG